MRVVFMGSPEFSVPALDALMAAGHEIVAVYCQPPRPAGRGKKERPTPVQSRAEALGLNVRHPVNFRSAGDVAEFSALNADIAVVVAYGLILPPAILAAPRHGCLNIHASLLPRWRGAAPIHRAIMAGDRETGISIMQMDAGLDTGAVLMSRKVAIGPLETTGGLHDRLAALGATTIVEALEDVTGLVPQAQSEAGVTYAEKITKAEARIDWALDASHVDQHIRGLAPFPGAWCEIEGQRVKVLLSEVVDGAGSPGEVIGDDLVVACKTGAVRLLHLQRAGKGAMAAADFLRGTEVSIGRRLG